MVLVQRLHALSIKTVLEKFFHVYALELPDTEKDAQIHACKETDTEGTNTRIGK